MAKVQKRFIGLAALVAVFFLSAAAGWAAIDPSTVQKLVAGDGYNGEYFGFSVSISGNTAMIGSPYDGDNGANSGSVYVFVRDGYGTWTQQAKILPVDGTSYDYFGHSVSISGDTAVIGAIYDDDIGENFGSAYVFIRSENTWSLQTKLFPDDGDVESFGSPVSISGNTVVIGSRNDNDKGESSGSAYVFVRNETGNWSQDAKLVASDGSDYDNFACSVSIFEDTIVVGAYKDDDNGYNSGSAYVFVRSEAGSWILQTKLLADDGSSSDWFGRSVSVSANTVAIGTQISSNSAYIFTCNNDGIWTQQAKLFPTDVSYKNGFGRSVSISDDTAIIGASDDRDIGYEAGAAYLFTRDTKGVWNQQRKLLANDGTDNDAFGGAVDVSGDIAIVATLDGAIPGSAYVYSSTPTTSNVTVTVTAPTSGTTYNHGNQVTINWETENADPADTMVLSMKRDAASSMTAPDNRSWYRFTENTPNDGTETVTIPDSVVAASDWRFYVRHVASNAYDAADATVTLEQAANTHKLYVGKTGEGSGSITSNPGSISCGDACKNTNVLFASGETVVLTATPSNCSKLVGWKGCDSFNISDDTCTVTMDKYREVTAQFAPETDTGTLRVLFDRVPYEAGYVTSDPLGIIASSTDISAEHRFCVGDTVRLTAQPAAYPRTVFQNWTIYSTPNNPCNGDQNSNVCDVTITSEMKVIHPSFQLDTTQPYNLHVRVSGLGKGHVTSQMRNLNCGNDGTGTTCDIWLNDGNQDTLSAVAAPGSKFVKWSGWGSLDCNGRTEPDCPYTMIWPHEVEAIFSAEDLGVSVSASVDALISGIDTSFEVLIGNNTDEDSHQTTVDINTLVNEQPYDQLVWQCGDNTGKGTCQKMDQDTFQVTVNGGESVVIHADFLEVGQKQITVTAQLTNSSDANPDNDHDEKELFSDLAALGPVENMTLLKFHQGQLYDAQERNTIIFTHGWQPYALGGCDAREGIDRLECYGKELWTGGKAFQQGAWLAKRNGVTDFNSPNIVTDHLNIIQYIWQGAYKSGFASLAGEYIASHKYIKTAGKILGKKIVAALKTNYAGKVHLVGHSMGTIVNAYAVRYMLDQMPNAKIQMTILDHPNRISRILLMFDFEEKIYGFDKDWFAELLPEIDDPSYKDRLLVDNYFAEEKIIDSKFETAGVGTPITGVNVYNHETETKKGLHDPNDFGDTLFKSETSSVLPWILSAAIWPHRLDNNNDHSGVHQWYRWTMWPSQQDGLTDNNFICSNREWIAVGAGDSPAHESLDPCESGFAFSILQSNPQPFPDRNGESLRERKVTTVTPIEGSNFGKDCTMDLLNTSSCSGTLQETAQLLRAEESSLASAEPIDTAASYGATEINLSHDVDRISFEYQFNNNVEGEYVHLLLDGRIVWSLDEIAAENGTWEQTGKIPVALEKGKHHLMLVYNQQTDTSSFAMRELQFFEAPNKNGFLPAMLFLLLNK